MLIISVVSYRGGSGKSLFSLNFAYRLDKKTLLLEADFLAPSLHYIVPKAMNCWNDYLSGKESDENALVNSVNHLDIICTKPYDQDMISLLMDKRLWSSVFSDNISKFFMSMEKKYDLIVIDNQSGTFYSTLLHCFFSDFVICIVRPDKRDVLSTVEYLKILKKPFYLVWNQVIKKDQMKEIIEKWTEDLFKPLTTYRGNFGMIPFDEESAFRLWVKQEFIIDNTPYHDAISDLISSFHSKFFKIP